MINRCVCVSTTFRDLLDMARREGLDFEALADRTGCARRCTLCEPFIRAVLATGEVDFKPAEPSEHAVTNDAD